MRAGTRQETMLDILSGSRILVGVGVMGIAAFLMASSPQAAAPAFGGNVQIAVP